MVGATTQEISIGIHCIFKLYLSIHSKTPPWKEKTPSTKLVAFANNDMQDSLGDNAYFPITLCMYQQNTFKLHSFPQLLLSRHMVLVVVTNNQEMGWRIIIGDGTMSLKKFDSGGKWRINNPMTPSGGWMCVRTVCLLTLVLGLANHT